MQIKNDILMLASTLHSNPKFLYISSEEEVGSKIPSDGVLKSLFCLGLHQNHPEVLSSVLEVVFFNCISIHANYRVK